MTYSIDTSALIDWWVRYYPPQNFPTLVGEIGTLIEAGLLRATKEVLEELRRQDDDLYEWARNHPELFLEASDPVQTVVTELMDRYYIPDRPEKGISGADPFVIAVAMTEDPAWKVVSGEKPGSAENPKIPYVCNAERLVHLSFLDLIQEQGWRF